MKKHYKLMAVGLFVLFAFCLLPMCRMDVKAAAKISRSSLKIAQGKTRQLKVKGTSAAVKWSSSNSKIVSVDNGLITAKKGGNATITAKAGTKRYQCKVTVVGLNAAKVTLGVGGTYTLKVKNGKNTQWSTSNKTVAKVTAKGKIKAKKTGTADITCKSNGRKVKCRVYVASLNASSATVALGSPYQLQALNYGSKCTWTSSKIKVASVDSAGVITPKKTGKTTITCKTGKAVLTCAVKVISPDNIMTPMSSLPAASNMDRISVTIEGYPSPRTYTVYKQSAAINKSGTYPDYMPYHGCAACALTTVLSGYANMQAGPVYTIEGIEKNVLGSAWAANYSKYRGGSDSCMPISLYGITKVLDAYNIKNEYVRAFDDAAAYLQITAHLKTGNPVIIEVSNKNRSTKKTDTTWANSKHTMVLLGLTDSGMAIVADSANRTGFGNAQRIKYASVLSLIPYMFPCTNTVSTSVYYTSESACGGYVLVNPQ